MPVATGPARVVLPHPHPKQKALVRSKKKRTAGRAGRRSGKTTGLAIRSVERFLEGARVLYAAPTIDQVGHYWFEVKQALAAPIAAGIFRCNETQHLIELPGTKSRIRAKTAWDADSLRGDHADELILDEYQLMNEDVWERVAAPMLMDSDGCATFLYTPPSMESRSLSKARDKLHASKLFKRALEDDDWETVHFTSYDNPHISRAGIERARRDMSETAFRMEVLAEDVEQSPAALWKRDMFGRDRYRTAPITLPRVVVGVDPTGSSSGDECGIVVAGIAPGEDPDTKELVHFGYVLADYSAGGLSPEGWGRVAVDAYHEYQADLIVGETNFGGDMVESTIRAVDATVAFQKVNSSRGKAVRAQPISVFYKRGLVYHVEEFPDLESQMCLWQPDSRWSPDRMDALVFAFTELMVGEDGWTFELIL